MTIKSLCPVSDEDKPATEGELKTLFDHYKKREGSAWFTLEQMAKVFLAAIDLEKKLDNAKRCDECDKSMLELLDQNSDYEQVLENIAGMKLAPLSQQASAVLEKHK